jgi:hypothetical protein
LVPRSNPLLAMDLGEAQVKGWGVGGGGGGEVGRQRKGGQQNLHADHPSACA